MFCGAWKLGDGFPCDMIEFVILGFFFWFSSVAQIDVGAILAGKGIWNLALDWKKGKNCSTYKWNHCCLALINHLFLLGLHSNRVSFYQQSK